VHGTSHKFPRSGATGAGEQLFRGHFIFALRHHVQMLIRRRFSPCCAMRRHFVAGNFWDVVKTKKKNRVQ
jgi:hypothetical protein